MSAQVIPFRFAEARDLRAVVVDGEPWFVAADVAAILELGNPRPSLALLDDDERGVHTVDTLGGPQSVTIISEPGLYSLILRSRRPEAKQFKRWLVHEVVPAIRKTGSYGVARALPQNYAEALRALADESEAHEAAKARVAELETPAAAWDRLATSGGDWSVQEAAAMLARDPSITIGRQRLFDHMAASHWVFRKDRHWLAYASAMDSGWLAHRAQHHIHPRTSEVVLDPPQVRVTAKGLARLHRMLGGTSPLVPLGVAS